MSGNAGAACCGGTAHRPTRVRCACPVQRAVPARRASRSPAPGAVVLHPGTGAPARRWPIERYAAVAAKLRGSGRQIAVTAGPDEGELLARIAGLAGLPGCRAAGAGAALRSFLRPSPGAGRRWLPGPALGSFLAAATVLRTDAFRSVGGGLNGTGGRRGRCQGVRTAPCGSGSGSPCGSPPAARTWTSWTGPGRPATERSRTDAFRGPLVHALPTAGRRCRGRADRGSGRLGNRPRVHNPADDARIPPRRTGHIPQH